GDAPQRVAAARAGRAVPGVDDELVAELGLGQAARAFPFALQRIRQGGAHLVEQALSLLGAERRERGVGRQLRSPQRVVRVSAADARHGALIAQQRVHPAAVLAVEDELGELVGVRLGSETLDGTDLALADHPPPRFALRAVLAHQQRDVVIEPEPYDAALAAARRLGRLLDVEATGLREVYEDARAAELEDQVLAPPGGARERPADDA